MAPIRKLLEAFGVKVAQEHLDAIEKILPQVPHLIQQGTTVINGAVQNFDARLRALETAAETHRQNQQLIIEHQLTIKEKIQELIDDGRNRSDNNDAAAAGKHGSGNDNGKHRSDARSSNRRR